MIITGKKFSKPEMSRVVNGDVVLKQDEGRKKRNRLDLLLVAKYPDYNRSTLQNFIKSGFVTVDGKVKFACVDGPDFDGHLVDFDEAIKRSKIYAEQERKARDEHCNLMKAKLTDNG